MIRRGSVGRRLFFNNNVNEEFNNQARRAHEAIRLQLPQQQMQIQPQPLAGIAFEIHNQFNKINKEQYYAFMEGQMPGISKVPLQTALINPMFGNYILTTLNELKATLPNANKPRVGDHISRFQDILQHIGYSQHNRKFVFYALEFVKRQPQKFKNYYLDSYSSECVTAYPGANNPLSCGPGIVERLVTTLTAASRLYAGTQIYDELFTILNPVSIKDILISYGSECSNANPDNLEDFRRCIHTKVQEQLGEAYTAEEVNNELNAYIPMLGVYEGGRRRNVRKPRKIKTLRKRLQKSRHIKRRSM